MHRLAAYLLPCLLLLPACADFESVDGMDGSGGIGDDGGGKADQPGNADDGGGAGDDEPAGGSSTGGGVPGCGENTFVLEHQPADVMLVLDKSYSMVDPENLWDHDDDPETEAVTRWSSLHASAAFLLEEYDAGLNFGAVLFPSADVPDNDWETACEVAEAPEVGAAPDNGPAIMARLPDADDVDLYGGTPAGGGIATALAHLQTLDSDLPKALILITDGAANCLEGTDGTNVFLEYDEQLPEQVAGAYEDGVPTYVIGIDILDEMYDYPRANPLQRLNEVAIAGGHPKQGPEAFYNTRDEAELRAAMSQISSQIGCVVELEEEPIEPDLLSVSIDGEPVPWVESCDDAAFGWHYQEPEGPYDAVVLCADACSAMHNAGAMAVEYACIEEG